MKKSEDLKLLMAQIEREYLVALKEEALKPRYPSGEPATVGGPFFSPSFKSTYQTEDTAQLRGQHRMGWIEDQWVLNDKEVSDHGTSD